MNSFESKEKYLNPDSLSDRQPVQLYKERSSMVILPGAGNQSSSGVLNQLQFFDNIEEDHREGHYSNPVLKRQKHVQKFQLTL